MKDLSKFPVCKHVTADSEVPGRLQDPCNCHWKSHCGELAKPTLSNGTNMSFNIGVTTNNFSIPIATHNRLGYLEVLESKNEREIL